MADDARSGTGRLMMPQGVCRLWPDLPPDRLKSWVESSLDVYTTGRLTPFPHHQPARRDDRSGRRSAPDLFRNGSPVERFLNLHNVFHANRLRKLWKSMK